MDINDTIYISVISPLQDAQIYLTKLFFTTSIVLVVTMIFFTYKSNNKRKFFVVRNNIYYYRLILLSVVMLLLSMLLTVFVVNSITLSNTNMLHSMLNETAMPIDQNIDIAYKFKSLLIILIVIYSILYAFRNIKANSYEKTHKK